MPQPPPPAPVSLLWSPLASVTRHSVSRVGCPTPITFRWCWLMSMSSYQWYDTVVNTCYYWLILKNKLLILKKDPVNSQQDVCIDLYSYFVPPEYCSVLLWWARWSSLRGLSHMCRKWHQLSPILGSWWKETTAQKKQKNISLLNISTKKWFPAGYVQKSWHFKSKSLMMSQLYTDLKKSARFDFSCAPAWSQHCHNIVPAYLCVRQKSAHLLVSPRQQHTGVLAKSLILIFYEGTQRQALEYLPCKSTAYHINYSAGK